MKSKEKFNGYRVALACAIIEFMHTGTLGSIGVFLMPISQATGISFSSIYLVVTFATVAAAISSNFLGKCLEKFGARTCIFIGTLACVTHFIISSFASSAPIFYVSSAIGGIALVFSGAAATTPILSEWFIERRGKVLGLVFGVSAFGLGVWQSVAGYLIDAYGFRTAYRVMAAIVIIIAPAVNFLLIRSPKQLGQKALGWEKEEELKALAAAKAAVQSMDTDGYTLKEARKTPSFWMIYAAVLLGALCINYFKNSASSFLQSIGYSTVEAANFTAARSMCTAALSIVVGFVVDKLGSKLTTSLLMLCTAVGSILIGSLSSFSYVLLFILVVLTGFGGPAEGSLVGVYTKEAFGDKDFIHIQPAVVAAAMIGSAFNPLLTSVVLKLGGTLKELFIINGLFAAIAGILFVWSIRVSPYAKLQKEIAG